MHHSAHLPDGEQHRLANDRHGAVLNDGVALVAVHHADFEEPVVLPVDHLLEEVALPAPVVLGRLDNTHLRPFEVRHEGREPVGTHDVVAVDHRHELGRRIGVLQSEIKRSGLVARVGLEVEESKLPAQRRAVRLNRLPQLGVRVVVVDDEHLVVGVVERRQAVQGVNHHVRRLLADGHVNRNSRGCNVGPGR